MSSIRKAPSFCASKILGNPIFSQVSSQALSQDGKKTTMFFVIPPGQSESSVRDKSLGEMYRTAEAHFLNVQWIEDENCADQVLESHGNIFVFDPFGSVGFFHWEKHGKEPFRVEILGPQVLRYVFNSPETITFQTKSCPTFTLAMRNMIITLSGIKDRDTKEEMEKLVRYMNGTLSASLTKAVTHVITAKTITPKCLEANKEHIPLMTPDWVREVWKSNQDFAVNASDKRFIKYVCPIFYNVNICLSQLTPNKKSALKSAIELLGGKVSPDLVKGTTDILVVTKAEGDKYKFAQKWKITCVTPEWVENSKENGHLLPLDDYAVTSYSINGPNFFSTPANSHANVFPDFNDTRCSAIMENTTFSSIAVVNETNVSRTMTQSEIQEDAVAQLRIVKSDDYYLDGCKIYLVDSEKSNELKKLLNASGAVRHDTLVDGITHVIVPGQKLPKVVQDKVEALDPPPYIVTIQWLLESAKQGGPADEDVFKFECHGANASVLAPETLMQPPPPPGHNEKTFATVAPAQRERVSATMTAFEEPVRTRVPASSSSAINSTTMRSVSITTGNEQTDDSGTTLGTNDDEEEEDDGTTEEEESEDEDFCTEMGYSETFDDEKDEEPVKRGLFSGISFKILISDAEERTYLRETVLGNGGKLRRLDPTVIILDPVCRKNDKLSAEKAHTKYWLFNCLETRNLDCDRSFLYFPLPRFRNMNLILKDVVIAISQYNVSEREYLVELVRALGGTYQDVFARKDAADGKNRRSTHLICKNMDTEKAKAARKWGVPVVVAEWVLESFVEKRRVEEAKYDPTVQPSCSDDRTVFLPTPQRRKSKKQAPARGRQMDSTNDTNNKSVFPPTAQKANPVPTVASKTSTKKDSGTASIADEPVETGNGNEATSLEVVRTDITSSPKASTSKNAINPNISAPNPVTPPPQPANTSVNTSGVEAAAGAQGGETPEWMKTDSWIEYEKKKKEWKAAFPYSDESYEALKQSVLAKVNLDDVSPFTSFEERRFLYPDSPLLLGLPRAESRSLKEQIEIALNRSPSDWVIKLKRKSTPMSELARRFEARLAENSPGESPVPQESSTPKGDRSFSRRRSSNSRLSEGNTPRGAVGIHLDFDDDAAEEVDSAPILDHGIRKLEGKKRPSDGSPENDAKTKRSKLSDDSDEKDEEGPTEKNKVSVEEKKSTSPNENSKPNESAGSSSGSSSSKKNTRRMQALADLINESQPPVTSENMSPVKRQSGNKVPVLAQQDEKEDEIEKPHLSIVDDIDQEEVTTVKKAPAKPRKQVEQEPELEIDENEQGRKRAGRPKKGSSIIKPQVTTRRTRSRSRTRGEDNVPYGHQPIQIEEPVQVQAVKDKKRSTRGKKKDPTTFPFELPRQPTIMVSSLSVEMKSCIGKLLEDLGGRLSSVATYDPKADALITGSLIRSEKVLGCIAAAKFLLKPSYIIKCRDAGKFLPIDEESLWHEGSINLEKERELASASFKWLQAQIVDKNKRPMFGMKFFLIDQPQDKLPAFHRLIFAAGGEVVTDIKQATTIIKEDKSNAKVPSGIEVRNAMHLNSLVLMDPPA